MNLYVIGPVTGIEDDLAVALGIPCKTMEEWLNERLPA